MLLELSPPTLIAEDSHIEGAVNFYSNAQIFGRVEGDVLQQSVDPLLIGTSGWVRGSVSSQGPIVISGRVEGTIHSKTRVELLPGALVQGTIVTACLQISPGAMLNGEVTMRWAIDRAKSSKEAA
jgi:cytoskeletal protein CcmA (bactofilin family)